MEQWELAYAEHYALLVGIAAGRFRVPADEAEVIAQEVLLAYATVAASVQRVRAWLVAATCNASRNYWRANERLQPLDDQATLATEDKIIDRVTVAQLLNRVSGKHREVLRLRYVEGCSTTEIAHRLRTTPRYAEKLLRIALQRLRGEP